MSKAIQFNTIYPEKTFGPDYVPMSKIEEAVQGLQENGEKIVSILVLKYNQNGEAENVVVVTEVEF